MAMVRPVEVRPLAGYRIWLRYQDGTEGEVVAELLPPRGSTGAKAQEGLADRARRGLVSLGARNDPRLYRRMPGRLKPAELQRLVDEERGER